MSGPGAFTVRVLGADGVPAGIGALVAERHVLTCAHVVNVALGRDEREQGPPTGVVTVDFPLLAADGLDGVPAVQASVERWLPPPRPGASGDDIAVLAIDRTPAGAVPARLAVDPPRPGRTVRVFGCPRSRLAGGWVEATVQGIVTGGRLQLDSRAALRVERGFSGSPVFDEDIGQVVGLVALAPARADERDSYAISTERLRLAWPGLLGRPERPDREDTELTILHVSGLRFGRADPTPFAQLTEQGPRADLMVVTGDLTERARPSEYRQAVEFLTALSAAAGIPRRHVAIVPGRHDVNRMACQAYFAEQESREAEPVPPYYPKWHQFAQAFRDFYAGTSDATFTPDEPWTLFEMRDLAVVVAGLNSTMAETHREADQYGQVGESQLRWFASRLADFRARGWLRLAAVYHGPGTGGLRDEQALGELLGETVRVSMLLHGGTDDWYQLITVRRDATVPSSGDDGASLEAAAPLPARAGRRDELFMRVVEATRARYPDAGITQRPADGYLRVTLPRAGGITEQWPVGVIDGPASEDAVASFASGVHAQFASADPQVPSELVHNGPAAPDSLIITARQRGVRLRSLIEYQGLLDLRPLAQAQRERLAVDQIYAERFYVPQRFRIVDRAARIGEVRSGLVEQVIGWLGADEAQLVVVLGDFGRGKTSFLRQLTRTLPAELPGLLPILVELRTLEKAPSLEALLVLHLASQGVQDINPGKLRYMIDSGRVALLFDGFDELELRVGYDNAADYLRTLLASVTDRAKLMLTSRTQHFRSTQQVLTALGERVAGLAASRVVVLEDFSAEQITEFLIKFYNGDEARAQTRLELLGNIGNLLDLAHNPRMLAFIAALDDARLRAVHGREGQISAAELYREIIDSWLTRETERQSHDHGLPALGKDDRFDACTALALRLWASNHPTIGLSDLSAEVSATLTRLAERGFSEEQASHSIGSGSLLVRTEDGAFTFVHQSIMEWLVAAAAAANLGHIMTSRRMSRLTTEFCTDLAGHDAASDWANATLIDPRASQVAKQNALGVLAQTGRAHGSGGVTRRNMAGLDLRDTDLNGRDLRGTDLAAANLSGVRLRGADLTGADLTGADLRGARLVECSLDGASLRHSRWDRAALLGDFGHPTSMQPLREAAVPGRDRVCVMIKPSARPTCVAFSPDGALLAVGSNNTVELLDVPGFRTLRILDGHTGSVRSVAFSPDGVLLATAADDRTVRIWDVASGETASVRKSHSGPVLSVAFSPDGTLLATASADRTAQVWDMEADTIRHNLIGEAGILDVAFSPDGTLLATASADRTAQIWDLATGTIRTILSGHGSWVLGVAFSPDGTLLATASRDRTASIWDVATGAARTTFAHGDEVLDVAFSPDGTLLATAGGHSASVWEVATEVIFNFLEHYGTVRGLAFSPSGSGLATAADDRDVAILDLGTGIAITAQKGGDADARISFSPDGNVLAAAFSGSPPRRWDLSAGTAHVLPVGQGTEPRVAFSPNGRWFAASAPDGKVALADPRTWTIRVLLAESGKSTILDAAYSPDGKKIVTGADNGTARTWSARSCAHLGSFHGHKARIHRVAFSPDGRLLGTASLDETARLWDATRKGDADSLVTLRHGAAVLGIGFSSDGARLATGSADGDVKIWGISEVTRLAARVSPAAGAGPQLFPEATYHHHGTVYDVAFSPDATMLATAAKDCAVRIWEIGGPTGQEPAAVLYGHAGPVRAVTFSPDGSRLATGSEDNTIRIWDLGSGQTTMTLVELPDGGYATLLPDGRYKLKGDPGDRLWWAVKLCRFVPGELDDYVAGLTRLPEDAPLSLGEILSLREISRGSRAGPESGTGAAACSSSWTRSAGCARG